MKAEEVYNESASQWERKKPTILTDFSVRPLIFEWCDNLTGKSVLDLGCGEGYVSRYCKSHGASRVLGVDISEGMYLKALTQEQEEPLGIDYRHASITEIAFENSTFDIALGVFVFNYLTIEQTKTIFTHIFQWLKPKGQFIFSLPHPLWPFLSKPIPPTYFDPAQQGYFSGRDKTFLGKIWRLDGSILDIQLFHKTFSDIFECLHAAGFQSVPECRELPVPKEFMKEAPDLCVQGDDLPLHLVLKIEKQG